MSFAIKRPLLRIWVRGQLRPGDERFKWTCGCGEYQGWGPDADEAYRHWERLSSPPRTVKFRSSPRYKT